jgi:predicted SprT family Zn-dependent metalloprotease
LTLKELHENNTIVKLSPPPSAALHVYVHLVKRKSHNMQIIANVTNIPFEQMAANIRNFLRIKIYIYRCHCDEYIMFVRMGHDRICREDVE